MWLPSIWIPKGSPTTANCSGMVDSTVARGSRTGEEVASMPAELVQSKVKYMCELEGPIGLVRRRRG
ncbi:hypothetical protein BKA67DRAFT_565934 [Truncatella angustata]|uniref:Uncharacterized protein n=1 Tax=Truncatella angustata TaxID=152316 RepID=A0A9P8ULX3_9PEZI|nr:uncharacterized protein BKA67DRAFT_565934 [Truncatella angustata]KAH6654672.1 hypothetical protein BKA67DRAFT_565934 [Truncatella angustata]